MYREPAAPDPNEAPPAELLYTWTDRSRRAAGIAAVQLFSLPAVIGAALAAMTTPTMGLVGIVVSSGLTAWWWRRSAGVEAVVLRVERGELLVLAPRAKVAKSRYRLDDLDDVALDSKTIKPVQEGASAIPAMRFIDSRVGPEIDKARIVLVGARGDREPLTAEYLAHMDTTEQYGKIRVFLRKHGWIPEDEREASGAPSSA